MSIVILECGTCRHNLRWHITEKNFPGVYICDQYPEEIPEFVEEGTKDCPKFQAKKNNKKSEA